MQLALGQVELAAALASLITLVIVAAARFFLCRPRVHGESREATAGPGRVPGDEASLGRGRPGGVHGADARVHGPETSDATSDAQASDESPDDWTPRIFMGVKDTVDEFVAYMLMSELGPFRYAHDGWVAQFRRWGLEHRIALCPDTIFLAAFGRHPAVRKGRERAKRANGTVIRLDTEARSPKRPTIYILEQPRALPGRVPVAHVVAPRPIETKRQREAAKAAAAQPTPQPERRRIAA